MPQLLPLRGLRYTPKAGAFGSLLAPPYDVIGPDLQRKLAASSPYNAVHLELAADGADAYAAVADRIRRWLRDGIVAQDPEPTLYCYEQEFLYEGQTYRRRSLIVGVEAQPWEVGAVRPHEYTMTGPKEDRLRLLQAAGVQFSPVFLLARDRAGALRSLLQATCEELRPAIEGASLDGDVHRLWLVEAHRAAMRALAPLFTETFYVADGHHRYETAVAYKRWLEEREGPLPEHHPARYAMAAVVPLDDPGLVVRPIHRRVPQPAPSDWETRLAPWWEVERLPDTAPETIEAGLGRGKGAVVALGLEGTTPLLLTLRDAAKLAEASGSGRSAAWMSVPPNAVYWGIIRPLWGLTEDDLRAGAVEYLHSIPEALAEQRAAAGVVLLLNPVDVRDVVALADRGERLPQKSTFFHPKLATGVVFHALRDLAG